MLRALVSVQTKTELLDAAQTLKLRSVDQSHHQLAFVGVSLQTNDVVDWIAVNAFRHCANINRRGLRRKVFYRIYTIFMINQIQASLPVDISGFSHFFGFEPCGLSRPSRVNSPNT